MPSLKDVKMKIVGVGKTKQITRAMNMVASAKLRGAQARIEKFRPYAAKYRAVVGALAAKAQGVANPLLAVHAETRRCAIILVTSDRGLCGGFNANIIADGLRLAKEKKNAGIDVEFICIGRKGRDAIRVTDYKILDSRTDVLTNPDFNSAIDIAADFIKPYLELELDEVWMVYGEFKSIAHQPPARLQLLPMVPPAEEMDTPEATSEYLYEPDEARLLDALLPRYINVQVYRALLDTSASEHAARMAAMDNATRNCNEMINTLTLLFNKTRQATITSELIDIVGGAEALKG